MPAPDPKQTGTGITLGVWLSDLIEFFFPAHPAPPPPPAPPLFRMRTTAAKVAPGPVTNVITTALTTASVTLSWTPPTVGTKPFSFLVLTRVHGVSAWGCGPATTLNAATINGLLPRVVYDFEILCSNN